MSRIPHYIKKNARSESPSNVLIVDTEANIIRNPDDSQEQTFRLGVANHMMLKNGMWYESMYELRTIDDFWKLLDRIAYAKKRLYIFAHHMAYDYAILKIDTYLSSRNLKLRMRVVTNDLFLLQAKNLVFLSTTNFYHQKLEELGPIFGMAKAEKPDFEDSTDEELFPYCAQDVRVLTHIVKQHIAFIKDNNLGAFKPTLAGQSLTTFRHRFMHHELLVHCYPEILELESESYRGGRNEAFKLGEHHDITGVDVNSMYPYVMKNYPYPTKLITNEPLRHVSNDDLIEALKSDKFLLADCDLKLDKPLIGCKRDMLMFPIGNIRQVITSPEIEYLTEHPDCGRIIKTHSLVLYEKAFIFPEYVDYFYSFRKSTDNPAYHQMAKLMLNSLYGKFGQHLSSKSRLVTDKDEKDAFLTMMQDTRTSEIYTGIGSKYLKIGTDIYHVVREDTGPAREAIPIIASAVTSYARNLLFDLMQKANPENVLYCDTDSLFVNQDGLHNLKSEMSETELGKLKVEKSGTVIIRGLKDYTFNGEIKRKGIKKNAERLPDGRFKQYTFQTGECRYNNGMPDGTVLVKPVFKRLSGEYKKGIVNDGLIVPFSFDEWQESEVLSMP